MSMDKLLEYSLNYSDTGSIWFHSKDEATSFNNDVENNKNSKSFKYKTKLLVTTIAQTAPN